MIKNLLHKIFPILISVLSILILAIIFYPILGSDFTIINESIAIPDYNLEGREIKEYGTIQDNLIIQLLGGFKILEGFFFHHHMSFLLPVYYLDIGIDRSIHQYGILTSYFILFASKTFFNNVSINSYIIIIQSFLIIFPISMLILGYKMFKNKYTVCLWVLFYVFTFLLLDFLNFYLTPTVSPIRQILILFTVFFIYKVFIENKLTYLIHLYIFLILQSFVFIELSIFMIASLIIQLFLNKKLDIYKNIQKYNFLIFILIISIYILFDFNSDNYFSNFNFIFLGPKLTLIDLSTVGVLILLVMYIVSSSNSHSKYYLFIKIISNYGLFSLLYFIWNPAYNHLVPVIWPFSFLLLFFIDRYILTENFSSTFTILLLIMIFITSYAVKNYYYEKNIFYNSVVSYLEKNKLAIENKINIKTTMRPEYIHDSCRLIKKYEKRKLINLISIHDSYLPFLCDRANSKFDQLIINMVNDSIKNDAYNHFLGKEIIFVDNIIENENSTIYHSSYRNALDFRIKIMAVNEARNLFKKIIDNKYILLEKGKLISVYKKMN